MKKETQKIRPEIRKKRSYATVRFETITGCWDDWKGLTDGLFKES